MIRKAALRGLLGFPLGLAMSATITLVISLIRGEYSPFAPALVEEAGSALNAFALQYLLSGLCGLGCAAGSVVWEVERWSPLKKMALAFLVYTLSILPVAYACHWMEHTSAGILQYVGIFAGTFVLCWCIQYPLWKRRIRKITERMRENRPE